MAQDNLIDIEIPADVHAQAMGHIEGLNACLMPYLKTLTTSERKELFKLGDKNQSFLDKNLDYANQNPDLVPTYLNLELMTRDVNANAQLTSYVRRLSPLVVALDDTVMLTETSLPPPPCLQHPWRLLQVSSESSLVSQTSLQ